MSRRAVTVFATSRDGSAYPANAVVTIRARSVSITLEPATAVDTSEAIWATIVIREEIYVALGAADAVDANPISRATTITAILTEEWRQADSKVALVSRRTICCFARGEAMIAEASESRRTYRIVGICLVAIGTADTIGSTREARRAGVCISIRIATTNRDANSFYADMSRRALGCIASRVADSQEALMSFGATASSRILSLGVFGNVTK